MADFNDDIDLCMDCCLDYYGDPIVFLPAESEAKYKMVGILDEAVNVLDTSGEVPVETPMPVLSVKLSDFDALGIRRPIQHDQFVVKGNLYTVTRQPEDGWSESRIVLYCEGKYAG
ncbi:MAG: hypothetical protein IJ545_06895 [Alphaproteobacteria bacterium]|nr:hypothetical protein [Alphaproteobacteria bacterium]